MDTTVSKKSFGTNIVDFFKNIVIGFISIFSYAFKGAKACTFDLMVFIYNSISWKLDKAYRRTKDSIYSAEYEPDAFLVSGGKWYLEDDMREFKDVDVIAWMPLPEPCKGADDE